MTGDYERMELPPEARKVLQERAYGITDRIRMPRQRLIRLLGEYGAILYDRTGALEAYFDDPTKDHYDDVLDCQQVADDLFLSCVQQIMKARQYPAAEKLDLVTELFVGADASQAAIMANNGFHTNSYDPSTLRAQIATDYYEHPRAAFAELITQRFSNDFMADLTAILDDEDSDRTADGE